MTDRIDDYGRDDDTVIPGVSGTPDEADQAAIRADIRETRERMGHTLEDLSERLNPDRLKEQVKHSVREATIGRAEHMARSAVGRVDETRHSIMDTIRDNPLPAAMVGIGLGWLFWNGRRDDSYSGADYRYRPARGWDDRYAGGVYGEPYYGQDLYEEPGTMERARDRVSDLGESARGRADELTGRAQEVAVDVADRVRGTASDVADRTRSAAGSLARETRYRTHRLEDRFQDTLYESPLVLGAAAVALGLVAGLGAPTTRREVELMGGARDRLVNQAREMVGETTERVQQVAERVVSEAQSTAQEAAREQGLTSSGGGTGTQGDRAGEGLP
ncbi:MAG: DUF3618 domain-containing protein [Gemmatimonadota bacterium]|nr:DUF3618 domain-containing protein [Gemmatimonadota bacterium]